MPHKIAKSGTFIIVFSTALVGCAPVQTASGSVAISRCKLGSHTEAYPNNPNPIHAYKCRSDGDGYGMRNSA
jgi:hypothetical protein